MSSHSLLAKVLLLAVVSSRVQGAALTTTSTTVSPSSTPDSGTTTCITFDFPSGSSSVAGSPTTDGSFLIPTGGTVTVTSGTATESRSITQTIEPSGSLLFTCWTYTVPEPTSTSPSTSAFSVSSSDVGTTTDPVDVPQSTSSSTSHFVTYTVCT
ncbi:hypothetical protein MVEN_00339200 [Mycena venus]|uniref:Ig-like domain-containing protein n=1 Tax=Mycena venus TaxID=2733690 RepID=A0A8H6YTU4_9AGAR|nr:hypothetical protein MVEN_00339200 [Mycena venus]